MKKDLFTVENAKVAAVDYYLQSVGRSGYINNGEYLVAVKVTKVFVDLVKREVTTTFSDKDGKEYTQTGDCRFYESPESFEAGNTIRGRKNSAVSILSDVRCNVFVDKMDLSRVDCDFSRDENGIEYVYKKAWRFENGEPVETPLVIHSVVYDTEACRCKLVDGCFPDKLWAFKKEAFSFNEYKVVDEDGDEFVERGVNLRLSLTKEQSHILDELNATFQKAEDAGIRFVWDRDNCGSLGAYNASEVAEFGYDIGTTEDGGEVVSFKDVYFADTSIDFYDYCGCEDDNEFRMKPTEREKKRIDKTKK